MEYYYYRRNAIFNILIKSITTEYHVLVPNKNIYRGLVVEFSRSSSFHPHGHNNIYHSSWQFAGVCRSTNYRHSTHYTQMSSHLGVCTSLGSFAVGPETQWGTRSRCIKTATRATKSDRHSPCETTPSWLWQRCCCQPPLGAHRRAHSEAGQRAYSCNLFRGARYNCHKYGQLLQFFSNKNSLLYNLTMYSNKPIISAQL